jgi:hypothetical protein
MALVKAGSAEVRNRNEFFTVQMHPAGGQLRRPGPER